MSWGRCQGEGKCPVTDDAAQPLRLDSFVSCCSPSPYSTSYQSASIARIFSGDFTSQKQLSRVSAVRSPCLVALLTNTVSAVDASSCICCCVLSRVQRVHVIMFPFHDVSVFRPHYFFHRVLVHFQTFQTPLS